MVKVFKVTDENYGSIIVPKCNEFYISNYKDTLKHSPPAFCFNELEHAASFVWSQDLICKVLILEAKIVEPKKRICLEISEKLFCSYWETYKNDDETILNTDRGLLRLLIPPQGTVFCEETEFVNELYVPEYHDASLRNTISMFREANKEILNFQTNVLRVWFE